MYHVCLGGSELSPLLFRKIQAQVRPDDQSGYPPNSWITSLAVDSWVGHCPPRINKPANQFSGKRQWFQKFYISSDVSYTHTLPKQGFFLEEAMSARLWYRKQSVLFQCRCYWPSVIILRRRTWWRHEGLDRVRKAQAFHHSPMFAKFPRCQGCQQMFMQLCGQGANGRLRCQRRGRLSILYEIVMERVGAVVRGQSRILSNHHGCSRFVWHKIHKEKSWPTALRFLIQSLRPPPTRSANSFWLQPNLNLQPRSFNISHASCSKSSFMFVMWEICVISNLASSSSSTSSSSYIIIIRVENRATTCWTSCPLKAKNLGHHNTMNFYNHHVPGLKT